MAPTKIANNDQGWQNIKSELKINIKSKMKRAEQKLPEVSAVSVASLTTVSRSICVRVGLDAPRRDKS